ncbi:hypothetical protein CKJ85_03665 [Corynebacterium sp. NML 150383]|uniref:hypothetical protein n=1 Tax=Corynebacterium sp. NML 150383 TaxID=2029400 RepID=UPI000BAA7C17|nr:hypothetical protein [Corynebacterium sp. NML 150383]PAT04507.1 hypothetical protein CKJ85_03665 [Corynebacterium sp. NML 150383]
MTRPALIVALAALLALAACDGDEPAPTPSTVTETQTVRDSPAEQPVAQSDAPAPSCGTPPNDPREAYPSGSAPGRMPADDGSDFNYWIEDIDNAYDPCAPLSWIVFRGSLGDEHRPAGTGASIADGLALYVNGAPAQDMAAVDKIESVTPTPDGGVDLAWGERTGATAEGITAHYTVHLRNDGGAVVPVSGNIDEFNRWWNYPVHYLLGTYD